MMTDRAQKILNKVAGLKDIAEKAILTVEGVSPYYGINRPGGRILKAVGNITKPRPTVGPTSISAETVEEVIKRRTKTAGVVDRCVEEINELQWGHRHTRNPYAEANSTSRNTNYMADYFAKQSALLRPYRTGLSKDLLNRAFFGALKKKMDNMQTAVDETEAARNLMKSLDETGKKLLTREIDTKMLKHRALDNKLNRQSKLFYKQLSKKAAAILAHEKLSAKLRDVDPRNQAVAKARERGGLFGSGVGLSAAYLLTRNPKLKPLTGALGVAPGFVAGKAIAGTVAKAYEETKRAPKGSHNFHKKAELEKLAIIRKEKDGYHIYSHAGRHLGGPYSLEHAKKRLQQIEYFKKK